MQELILSKVRTLLAAKRTLLSNIRTALVCLSLAFAFMKLDKSRPIDFFTISLLILAGVFLVLGLIEFFILKSSLKLSNKKAKV